MLARPRFVSRLPFIEGENKAKEQRNDDSAAWVSLEPWTGLGYPRLDHQSSEESSKMFADEMIETEARFRKYLEELLASASPFSFPLRTL